MAGPDKEKKEAEATAEDSFDEGWDAAAPAASDDSSDGDPDGGPESQGSADDDHSDGETSSSETDEGSERDAEKGDAAAARSDDDPDSKAESAPSEDKTPAEGAESKPQTVEDRLDSLQEQLAKNDRDHKSELGRLRKQNKELMAQLAKRTDSGELPEDVQAAYDKLKEYDPEMAETMSKIMDHQRSQVDQRFQTGAEYVSQVSEAEQAQQLAVLDAELKDIPWKEYLARDQSGQFAHAQFTEFLGKQPMNAVNEFIYTEDAGPVAKMVRSFHASLGESEGGAAPKDSDTTDDGADEDQKATSQAKRRAAQKEATDGAEPSKGSGAKDADAGDDDSFDAGWKAAAKQETRHAA